MDIAKIIVFSGAFAASGIDVRKVELSEGRIIKKIFVDIPKASYEWHIEGSNVHSAGEYAKNIKNKLKEFGLMSDDGKLMYKEKELFWTQEMSTTYGIQNKNVFYNMIMNMDK